MSYPNTAEGKASALIEAGGDHSRLWYDGAVIRVLPASLPFVPPKVTRRQFRQGLTRLGLRAAVETWRAGLDTSTQSGQDAADWYDDSNEFERGNPILNAMAAQFGLSQSQVDAAFVMMAGL